MLDSKAIDRYAMMITLWQEIGHDHLERSPEFSLKALSRNFIFNSQK
jgi:hypothetical protein